MKQKKIASQLLKGYILILLLIITLGAMVYMTYTAYTNSRLEQSSIDMYQFMDDYDLDKQTAFSNQPFAVDDLIIITDKSYTILDTYNYDTTAQETFFDIEENINLHGDMTYYIFESDSGDIIYHLFLAPFYEDSNVMFIFMFVAILLFIGFAFSYAKMTSKKIVQPINALSLGVKAISNGDYDHVISYQTDTELDGIKDDINLMSSTLSSEINRRKVLEQERNELIMNLSHDIKTPLTNIIGYSQTLFEKELPEDVKSSIETIYKYGLIAAELTDELFDYTKINNHSDMITSSEDIVEITRVKLIEYINEFDKLDIHYTFELPEKPIFCQLNTIMYQRVLDNLIQNTIKYNHKSFELIVSIETNESKAVIVIQDNGIGIPINYHSTIFDPMVRVESSRNRALGGTGLGLSITKKIMLKHTGSIRLDSTYTDGCKFIIEMPRELAR